MTYAKDTSVSVERSKAQIEKAVAQYGATGFASAWQGDEARIAFEIRGVRVQLSLTLPARSDYSMTEKGRQRKPPAALAAWEQACLSHWRALYLVVKAKLEAVESGISTIEREFLADVMTPSGTIGHQLLPSLETIISSGRMPKLLSA